MILAASPSTAPAWEMIAIFVIIGAAALIVEYLYYRRNPGGAAAERPGSYYAWRERMASRHPLTYAAVIGGGLALAMIVVAVMRGHVGSTTVIAAIVFGAVVGLVALGGALLARRMLTS